MSEQVTIASASELRKFELCVGLATLLGMQVNAPLSAESRCAVVYAGRNRHGPIWRMFDPVVESGANRQVVYEAKQRGISSYYRCLVDQAKWVDNANPRQRAIAAYVVLANSPKVVT